MKRSIGLKNIGVQQNTLKIKGLDHGRPWTVYHKCSIRAEKVIYLNLVYKKNQIKN